MTDISIISKYYDGDLPNDMAFGHGVGYLKRGFPPATLQFTTQLQYTLFTHQ